MATEAETALQKAKGGKRRGSSQREHDGAISGQGQEQAVNTHVSDTDHEGDCDHDEAVALNKQAEGL